MIKKKHLGRPVFFFCTWTWCVSCLYQCRRRRASPIPVRTEALASKETAATTVFVLTTTEGSSVKLVKTWRIMRHLRLTDNAARTFCGFFCAFNVCLHGLCCCCWCLFGEWFELANDWPSPIAPTDCYVGDGQTYRGVVSMTEDGVECLDWHSNFILAYREDPFSVYADFDGLEKNNHCRYNQTHLNIWKSRYENPNIITTGESDKQRAVATFIYYH